MAKKTKKEWLEWFNSLDDDVVIELNILIPNTMKDVVIELNIPIPNTMKKVY